MAITDLTNTSWQFKQVLDGNAGSEFTWYIRFTFDGVDFVGSLFQLSLGSYYTVYVTNANTGAYNIKIYRTSRYSGSSGWTTAEIGFNPSPPIITITGGTDATNTDLIAWLEKNATLVNTLPSTVSYNGNEIVSIEKGHTVTLKCRMRCMLSDVIIDFSENGTITYNGTVTDVPSGNRATLSCKDKVMKDDIVITL